MGNYDIYKYKIHYFTCRVQHFQPENVRNYTIPCVCFKLYKFSDTD
jgi:hypothetical protein